MNRDMFPEREPRESDEVKTSSVTWVSRPRKYIPCLLFVSGIVDRRRSRAFLQGSIGNWAYSAAFFNHKSVSAHIASLATTQHHRMRWMCLSRLPMSNARGWQDGWPRKHTRCIDKTCRPRSAIASSCLSLPSLSPVRVLIRSPPLG